ncbi:hypothetical protein ACIPJK_35055 [Streptomyces roseus]|uniref:hypothetical protein n=1 Tax=Streptomyces roseus TaxID=66430 RepID=UPI003813F208
MEMAGLAPVRAESGEVKTPADAIKKAQHPEPKTLSGWLCGPARPSVICWALQPSRNTPGGYTVMVWDRGKGATLDGIGDDGHGAQRKPHSRRARPRSAPGARGSRRASDGRGDVGGSP